MYKCCNNYKIYLRCNSIQCKLSSSKSSINNSKPHKNLTSKQRTTTNSKWADFNVKFSAFRFVLFQHGIVLLTVTGDRNRNNNDCGRLGIMPALDDMVCIASRPKTTMARNWDAGCRDGTGKNNASRPKKSLLIIHVDKKEGKKRATKVSTGSHQTSDGSSDSTVDVGNLTFTGINEEKRRLKI